MGQYFIASTLNRDGLFLISCTSSALKPNFNCHLEEVLCHLLIYLRKRLSRDIVVHHGGVKFILWFISAVFTNALKVPLLNLWWSYLSRAPLESSFNVAKPHIHITETHADSHPKIWIAGLLRKPGRRWENNLAVCVLGVMMGVGEWYQRGGDPKARSTTLPLQRGRE